MAPGLADDVFAPFFEDEAFPLKTLIALHPDSELDTYMGKCLSLEIFGQSRTDVCERRLALAFVPDGTVIHWFAMGHEAVGLGSTAPLAPPKNRILTYMINKIYRLENGQVTPEDTMGTCLVDAFYVRCHTIGKSGRFDAEFATLGGPSTMQYPIEDAVFRVPNAEVFSARGQCIRLGIFGADSTPYCASVVARAVLDQKAVMLAFTADGHLV
ncbi:MAG: hypothetical protein P4L76_09925, partial [Beijerinckiaceae bacterium]|nr:hypothetical protein [Beijerinckiaceae bacterium]